MTEWYTKELLEPNQELTWELLDMFNTHKSDESSGFVDNLFNSPEVIGRTTFRFKRSGIEGTIDNYKEEVKISEIDNATSSNSLSITRKFNNKSDALKGKTSYLPFQPGGLVDSNRINQQKDETAFLHKDEHGLFDIPQGFTRGLQLEALIDDEVMDSVEVEEESKDQEISPETVTKPKIDLTNLDSNTGSSNLPFDVNEIDGIVPIDYSSIRKEMAAEKEFKKDWAHVVDLDHKIENFEEIVPNMARKWPFELDTFQQEAVYHLEQGDSVFVAAHTSAGKTVVAEYAIAMANRNMTKAIYTSPIKALSNQKFRDFKETFKEIDVGLITGDVQINPEANCLIMTTEILRSMLYRGADLIRDVEFVIFDEVHYVNDIDRGVVWEEVIIMLPDHIKYILLSATVPNTFEFANWVGRTKQKDIYVISTPKRPVPLEINIWAKNDLFKVIDATRKFSEIEFRKHKDALEAGKKDPPKVTMGYGSRGGRGGSARGGNRGGAVTRGGAGGGRGGRGGSNFNKNFISRDGPNKNTWSQLVQYLKNHTLLPAVIFVFSKKKCEEYADTLRGVDFCTAKEKSEIHMFIDRAVSRLKKEDRELPQILKIREMLSRGIAVHHGGLLPIVKECIEILFARTLVKVLFATETFAMGLNLPTRTVVFNNVRKHDGQKFRNLLPGEFTQMAGRAGRRGLDSTGTVIVMSYNEPLQQGDFKEVTLGTPTKLISQFRLTYNMILNLLRIEALRVEEMIKHSFSENSTQTLLPEHQKTVEALTEQLSECTIDDCDHCEYRDISSLYDQIMEYEELGGQIVEEIQASPLLRNTYLKIGKLICYKDEQDSTRCGFIIRSDFATNSLLVMTFNHGSEFTADAQQSKLPYIPSRSYLKKFFKKIKYQGDLEVTSVPFPKVTFLSRYGLKSRMKDILQNQPDAIQDTNEQIKVVTQFFSKWEQVPLSQVTQLTLHEKLDRQKQLLEIIQSNKCLLCDHFKTHFLQLHQRNTIEIKIDALQKLISDENLELLPDYEQRLTILENLGFIDAKHNVMLKGRVACEINSGWELIITELVLDNFLGDFEPEEIVALLSSFVYEGRTNEEEDLPLTPRLERGKKKILEITDELTKVFISHKILLTSEEEEFTTRKRFALMNVVYEWARGMSFNEIMEISSEAEGTIVRVITRLDEICREVKNAALIIGDSTLHSKMSQAQERIKRDIVFCGSLYL
ncbi:antiviral helicase Ski2p [[Candida] jaroonii]|uniref:Antiviral helicase Ski2p n=1 Tax=[Candida] jaroonii TaxID=467808 RepID=A0ACA9Y9X7_9ASCO|nr:antiviral helicase Ski2p [[Candida] jaroonii]